MVRLLAVSLSLLVFSVAARSADIAGSWRGTWTKAGDPLPVEVIFEKAGSGYVGHFDSDALQRVGIPLSDVTTSGDHVHFALKGDRTTMVFDGTLRAQTIEGRLAENGLKGAFRLARSTASPPVESRDVEFQNGETRLAGTLLLPPGGGRHPAILFLHGSGAEARFANRWLAQKFARSGFVALITDKRGVGQSTGDWKTSGFDDLAADGVSGIRFLQGLPEVNSESVGIYGHSQGGTIAPLVASSAGNLAFVIASAPGGIDPAAIEEYSIGNSIGIDSLSASEAADARDFVRAIVDVGYRGAPRDRLDNDIERFKDRSWYFDPPPPDSFYWAFSRRIANYDPAKYWRETTAPVLLLFGSKDERVPPFEGSKTIVTALSSGGNRDVALRIFPNLDHTFSLPVSDGGWPKRLPVYAETMIEWAKARAQ